MTDLIFNLCDDRLEKANSVYLIESFGQLPRELFSERELGYIQSEIENKKYFIALNYYYNWAYIVFSEPDENIYIRNEELRKLGVQLLKHAKENEVVFLNVVDELKVKDLTLAFLEGVGLSSYSFDKYKTTKSNTKKSMRVNIFSTTMKESDIESLEVVLSGVLKVRDLVNEPASYLTSTVLADEASLLGKTAGITVKTFRKEDIEKLKMGGILAVNKGSTEPPTFTVMEWRPANHKNVKPIVLVGKGVTYDTGGLSLKPTENSMDEMKSDMAGAAVVINVISAIARLKIPVYVISLIPSTDNRLSADSYAPGDVIRMYDGTTVEVLNSDAEGRLILADALTYAKQFDPELTIDVATLTGAAARAIGEKGSVVMGNPPHQVIQNLIDSGFRTNERLVEFPFWNDYADELKSEIADMKNIGSNLAGAITAGKFLEKFAPKSFVHIDIAGTAFYNRARDYYSVGGTGFGVRLLTDFIIRYYNDGK